MGEWNLRPRRVSAYFGRRNPVRSADLRLRLHGPGAKAYVAKDFRQIESEVGTLSPPLRDLVDIGAAAYLSDMFIPPEQSFYREIEVVIEVRDIDTWRPLSPLIDDALSFLMQSPMHLEFIEGESDGLDEEVAPPTTEFDHVVCLSGGLDSFAGVLTLGSRSRILLVSQFNSNLMKGIQTRVADRLQDDMENLTHVCLKIGQKKLGAQKYSVQPSRSFMYLALAGSAAIATRTSEVLMFENGPMAVGIPYTPARFHTRTVHPIFLDMMQQILRGIPGGSSIRLENPFQSLTKSEVVTQPPISKIRTGLAATCSCSHYWWVRTRRSSFERPSFKGWHCGWCLPCIHRRLSVLNAGCQEEDDEYLVSALDEYPFTSIPERYSVEALMNVMDLLSFARSFRDQDNNELFEKFPGIFFETERLALDDVLDMHRRLASQVSEVFESHGNQRLREDLLRIS